jgi:hypothetical protein
VRDPIELSADEAWALYTALDQYAAMLADQSLFAGAAAIDQLAQDLWRKLRGDEGSES